jgi:hypothetical protein
MMRAGMMIFTELRECMLRRFEAEESGGHPYRSEVLSPLGLAYWPDIRQVCRADSPFRLDRVATTRSNARHAQVNRGIWCSELIMPGCGLDGDQGS